MKNNIIIIVVGLSIAALVFFGGDGYIVARNNAAPEGGRQIANVSNEADRQIVVISAYRGYSPRVSIAKADVPTIIRFVTKNTFDCSAALLIQSLGVTQHLEPTGEFEVSVTGKPGEVLKGSCSMGMYDFQVRFE